MNDFKTCGCKPIESPFISTSAVCLSDSFTNPRGVVLDCTAVTFKLKELDIELNTNALTTYLDAINYLTINGVKFIKLESGGTY